MAEIVLGIGTSHTPLLSLPAEQWEEYARRDATNPELVYPPNGWVLPFSEAQSQIPAETRAKFRGTEPFEEWSQRCTRALDTLAATLQAARADVTVIVSDDQDEWLFEHNMPMFSLYWGESAPIIPRADADTPLARAIARGYGDIPLDVPVASRFGRYLLEYLVDHDFDMGHMTHTRQPYGGRVARRYPTPDGELSYARETEPREQGLPHGYAFIVKRLYENRPRPILPVIQNTCYPPNQPRPHRSYALGAAIADAVRAWPGDDRVAIIASGGLSHFVVDEELDHTVLTALEQKDGQTLRSLPRHRLYSATSETLNWVALGGAMEKAPLRMELIDYVPVYRTPAATGGGWAFARWQ